MALSDIEVWTLINNGINKYQQDYGVDLVEVMSPYGYNSTDEIAREFFIIAHGESGFDPMIVGDKDDPFGRSVGLWQSNLQHYTEPGTTNALGYTQDQVNFDPLKQIETAIQDAVTRTTYTGLPDFKGQPFAHPFLPWSVYRDRNNETAHLYSAGMNLYDLFSSNQSSNVLPNPSVTNPSTQPATQSEMGLTPEGLARYQEAVAAYENQDVAGIQSKADSWNTYADTIANAVNSNAFYIDAFGDDTEASARNQAMQELSHLIDPPNIEDFYEEINIQPNQAYQTAPQFQVAPEVTQAELDQDRFDSTALIGRNILQGLPTGEAQMNVNPEVYANLSGLDNVNPDLLFGGEFGNQLPTPTMDTIAKSTPMERENWNAAASMFELPDFTDLAGATKRRWSGRKETGSGLMNTAPRPSRPSMGGRALGSVRSGALGTPNRTPTSYRSPNSPSRNKAASIRSGRAGQIRSSR
tara:strand:- start:54 stop:1457 length:1404 start_codon:yes stop_codon:yes gene_type:complete